MRFILQDGEMEVRVLPASHSMTVDTYLTHLLQDSSRYSLTTDDQNTLTKAGLAEFIFSKLSSKKFRKKKLDPECELRTKQAIALSIKNNKPLKIVFPQGGYKLWRLPSSPRADWAEFFNLAYVLSYVAPLAAAYKPGVVIEYYLHTLLMEAHDNLTTEEISEYVDSFQSLVASFSAYLPDNISIQILKDADIYPREEYFTLLNAGLPSAQTIFNNFPQEKQQAYLKMARLNIKWRGNENWSTLKESEKEEQCQKSALYEIAATHSLPKVMERVKAPDVILIFRVNTKEFIGIGSCKASIAKHWVGYGVLATNKATFTPIILSPSQFQQLSSMPHKTLDTSVIKQTNFDQITLLNDLPDYFPASPM